MCIRDSNNTEYNRAVQEKNDAENITKVLYPNDNKYEGKVKCLEVKLIDSFSLPKSECVDVSCLATDNSHICLLYTSLYDSSV